jgi:hypothetical protein
MAAAEAARMASERVVSFLEAQLFFENNRASRHRAAAIRPFPKHCLQGAG